MIIKVNKKGVVFRNPELYAGEAKTVNLDHLLSNLYMLIANNGAPVSFAVVKGGHTVESLKEKYMKVLEEHGLISGVTDNIEGVEDWLRSNLVNMVNRGNVIKENVSALKPLHLMSYKIQNKKHNRDYNTSDQVFLMLKTCPQVLDALKDYLNTGWDNSTKKIVFTDDLDVDTIGILMLTKDIIERRKPNTEIMNTKPLLKKQTDLFNEDIRRLLLYKDVLPRTVFIDYLRTLMAFHLTLYLFKLIYLLPRMKEAGSVDIEDDWSLLVDVSNDLDSPIAPLACRDMERIINSLNEYFHVTFEINVIQKYLRDKGADASIANVLATLKDGVDRSSDYFLGGISTIKTEAGADYEQQINEMLQFFDQDDYFAKYIQLLENTNGGSSYQYPFHLRLIDSLSMKNSDSQLLADGRRSRKHPRRASIGSKLLETLVQLLVLEPTGNGNYESRALSIDELAQLIRDRYGLVINGSNEPRFAGADVETHAAFKDNMEAFKNKLRQIGFYTDLSDAYLLQKIRPRYKI